MVEWLSDVTSSTTQPIQPSDWKADMELLDKISRVLTEILMWIAGAFLVVMILLTCGNIFLRLVWTPVKGTFELMGFFGAIVTAFALGYTQIKRGHTGIDIVVNQFSATTQRILNSVNYFICMVFFGIAGWQIAKWATILWKTGEVTETLRIIFYPFTYGVSLGCFILTLVLLVDLLKVLTEGKRAS
jgi:TRAP-type C4-dicarboxylate transport system permease small subunit